LQLAVTFSTLEPVSCIVVGLTVAVKPVGAVTLRLTTPVNPLIPVWLIPDCADWHWGIVREDGLALSLKSWTTWVNAVLVLVAKLPSPLYTAVIEWLAAASELVVNVAVPPDRVLVPSVVLPSLNVTVPVGLPAPGAETATVAVKVTLCPTTDGLSDEVTVVVVLALFTTWVNTALVLPLKLESPLYFAVIEWDPTDSVLVMKVVEPDARVPVPRVVVPSRKVTVPVGVPVPEVGATVAVNVTDCPKTDGFADDVTVVVVPVVPTDWVRTALVLVLKLPSPP
jgi:hypothetical protein